MNDLDFWLSPLDANQNNLQISTSGMTLSTETHLNNDGVASIERTGEVS